MAVLGAFLLSFQLFVISLRMALTPNDAVHLERVIFPVEVEDLVLPSSRPGGVPTLLPIGTLR